MIEVDIAESAEPFNLASIGGETGTWSPELSFFQTSRWAEPWSDHLAPRATHAAVVATIDGKVAGALAITATSIAVSRHRHPRVPVIVTTGGVMGSADHLAPLLRQPDEDVLTAMLGAAATWRRGRFSVFPSVPALHKASVPGFVPLGEHQCPRADIPTGADWQSVQASWSQNRRKKIRQRSERFAALGGRFEWLSEPSAVLDGLDVVIDLHRQRWTDQGQQTQFGWSESRRRFLRDVVVSTSDGNAWVQLAMIDGTPVGGLFGFQHDGVISVYQSGWRADKDDVGIGLLQYANAYKTAVESNCRAFDMLRGADDYKMRFASHTVDEVTLVADGPFATPLLGRLLS